MTARRCLDACGAERAGVGRVRGRAGADRGDLRRGRGARALRSHLGRGSPTPCARSPARAATAAAAGAAPGVDPAAVDRAATDLRGLTEGGASPAEVADYFAGLDPAVAEALAAEHPELVGNTDGAPIPLRYAANAAAIKARDRSGCAPRASPRTTRG